MKWLPTFTNDAKWLMPKPPSESCLWKAASAISHLPSHPNCQPSCHGTVISPRPSLPPRVSPSLPVTAMLLSVAFKAPQICLQPPCLSSLIPCLFIYLKIYTY